MEADASQSQRTSDRARAFAEDLFGPTLPWYDSPWLQTFMAVRGYLEEKHPNRVHDLDAIAAPLRTNPDFRALHLPKFIEAETMNLCRAEIDVIVREPMSEYERGSFGRDLLHNRPTFTALAQSLAPQVGALVGEAVEPYYNFLSLYGPEGKCDPHMDAPEAKWTLDICIDQSARWPLLVSPVVPWPTDWDSANNPAWQDHLRASNSFTPITMDPSDAIIFGGSSQWHYRDPFPVQSSTDPGFCHLLFLHYIPAGCGEVIKPANWGALLGLPSVARLCSNFSSQYQTD